MELHRRCRSLSTKAAFNDLLDERRYNKNQLAFIGLVIDYVTEHGTIKPARIYESPFTGVAPQGPDELFAPADVEHLFEVINDLVNAAG